MSQSIKVSVLIPKRLDEELMHQMLTDGYGMRNKSKWIVEAIERLLAIKDFPNIIEYEALEGLGKMIVFSVPFQLKQAIEEAVITVRSKHPALEGVQSKVIRAAIMQRLICSK